MPTNNQLIPVVFAFINAETESESQHLLDTHRDLLVSDAAEQLLADWLEQSKDNNEAMRMLEGRLALLAPLQCEKVVQRFVRAGSWEARKELILGKSHFLLSNAAEKVLADLIELEGGEKNSGLDTIRTLQECRACLACCYHMEIGIACQIIEVLSVWLKGDGGDASWTEWQKIAEPQSELLLSDIADQALTILLEEYKDDTNATNSLQILCIWLAWCRRIGISINMAIQITEALDNLVSAGGKAERERFIESQRDILLTDAAEQWLMDWLELERSNRNNDNIIHNLQECQTLLAEGRRLNQLLVENPKLLPLRQTIIKLRSTNVTDLLVIDSIETFWSIIQNNPDLLSHETETFLLQWINQARSINDIKLKWVAERFEFILRGLRELREFGGIGIMAEQVPPEMRMMFANHQQSNEFSQTLYDTIMELFYSIPYGAETQAYIKAHPELLTGEANDILALMLEQAKEIPSFPSFPILIQGYRNLLARCREKGIESAFASTDPVLDFLTQFMAAPSEEELYELLVEHSDSEQLMATLTTSSSAEDLFTKYPELILRFQRLPSIVIQIIFNGNIATFLQSPVTESKKRNLKIYFNVLIILASKGFDAVLDTIEKYPQLLDDEVSTILSQLISQLNMSNNLIDKKLAHRMRENKYVIMRQLRELMAKTGFSVTQAILVLRLIQNLSDDDYQYSRSLVEAISELITTTPYRASRAYVEAHPELRSGEVEDIVEDIFARMLSKSKGYPDVTRLLQAYRNLLARYRQEGIDAAFAELTPGLLAQLLTEYSEEELLTKQPELLLVFHGMFANVLNSISPKNVLAIRALLGSENPETGFFLLADYPELLNNEIDTFLSQWRDQLQARNQTELTELALQIEKIQSMLHDLQERMAKTGVGTTEMVYTLQVLRAIPFDYPPTLTNTISEFVATVPFMEPDTYIKEHPELLSHETDDIFAIMLEHLEEPAKFNPVFQKDYSVLLVGRDLLAYYRQRKQEGVGASPIDYLLNSVLSYGLDKMNAILSNEQFELLIEYPLLAFVVQGFWVGKNELMAELYDLTGKIQAFSTTQLTKLFSPLEEWLFVLKEFQLNTAKMGLSNRENVLYLQVLREIIDNGYSANLLDTIILFVLNTDLLNADRFIENYPQLQTDKAERIFDVILKQLKESVKQTPSLQVELSFFRLGKKILTSYHDNGQEAESTFFSDCLKSVGSDVLNSFKNENFEILIELPVLAFFVQSFSAKMVKGMMEKVGLSGSEGIAQATNLTRFVVDPKFEKILKAYSGLVEAPNEAVARAILSEHPELLTDEAHRFLTLIDEIVRKKNPKAQFFFDWLVRSHEEGIDAVFPDNLTVSPHQMAQIATLRMKSEDEQLASLLTISPPLFWRLKKAVEDFEDFEDWELIKLIDKVEQGEIPQREFFVQLFEIGYHEIREISTFWNSLHDGKLTGIEEQLSEMTKFWEETPAELRDFVISAMTSLFFSSPELSALFTEAGLLAFFEQESNIPGDVNFYETALAQVERERHPELWVLLQFGLADCYSRNSQEDDTENIEQAIFHFQQVLEALTRRTLPTMWAEIHYELAWAYSKRKKGEAAENIEKVIEHYRLALKVFTRQDSPQYWAACHRDLGDAYLERPRGEPVDNIEQAIWHFQQSLEVSEVVPKNRRYTAYRLGLTLYEESRFIEARETLEIAHDVVESLRSEAQQDAAKRDLSEQNAALYAHLVACCLHEGDEAAAFGFAVAGKGRAFIDMLASARFDISAACANDPAFAADWEKDRSLYQQIYHLEDEKTSQNRFGLFSYLFQNQKQTFLESTEYKIRNERKVHWEEMTNKYPGLTTTQLVPALSVEQARTLSAELGATLVEYYRHANGWCAFVVTPDKVQYVPLPKVNDDLLKQMRKWIERIEVKMGCGKLNYKRLPEWHDVLIAPLREYLPCPNKGEDAVVLAPFDTLHLLPLAALRDRSTNRYLAQDYTLAFAPNLGALRVVHQRSGAKRKVTPQPLQKLLTVAYPSTPDSKDYLPNVVEEAVAIAKYFAQVQSLHESAATPEAVIEHALGQEVVHFGCHGRFNTERPNESGLMLARDPSGVPEELTLGPDEWLTVQDIIIRLDFSQSQLVTLGACQSGQAALRSGDEYVGLAQAIMITGAPAVVSSLWKVDDEATRALFEEFYTGIRANQSPATALRQAQELVRNQSGKEDPYWWAAFTVSGVAFGNQKPQMT